MYLAHYEVYRHYSDRDNYSTSSVDYSGYIIRDTLPELYEVMACHKVRAIKCNSRDNEYTIEFPMIARMSDYLGGTDYCDIDGDYPDSDNCLESNEIHEAIENSKAMKKYKEDQEIEKLRKETLAAAQKLQARQRAEQKERETYERLREKFEVKS